MRKLRNLWPEIIDADALEAVSQDVVRGKRRRPDIARFLLVRDEVLAELRQTLADGSWFPLGWRARMVRDPKPRVIAVAPVADRIVHAALVRVIEPAFLRSCTADSFACRRGFGTHRAVLRLCRLMRDHRWFVHLDIKSYFPSIHLATLKCLIAQRIADPEILCLIDAILEAGRGFYDDPPLRRFARMSPCWPPLNEGLPIGALTSQLFAAHVYLNGLDHFIKRDLKVPGYLRYVDDLILFGPTRGSLTRARAAIASWLQSERHLRLKVPEARVRRCTGTLVALGVAITRHEVTPLPRRWHKLRAAWSEALHRSHSDASLDRAARQTTVRVGHLLAP